MVRSPEASPELKKSKLDVFPDSKKERKTKVVDKTEVEKYLNALKNFKAPAEEELVVKKGELLRSYPNSDIDQYFKASALWGVPAISWDVVKPVFLWKLEFVINEFKLLESKQKKDETTEEVKHEESPTKEKLLVAGTKLNLIKTTPVVFNIDEAIDYIMEKARSFDGFPFTWQRICELLTSPTLHYSVLDKFVRGFYKVINVVTTITEWGGRVTGEWELPESDHPNSHHIENLFFGPVDEVEAMEQESEQPLDMTTKMIKKEENEEEGEAEKEEKKTEEAEIKEEKLEETESKVENDADKKELIEIKKDIEENSQENSSEKA